MGCALDRVRGIIRRNLCHIPRDGYSRPDPDLTATNTPWARLRSFSYAGLPDKSCSLITMDIINRQERSGLMSRVRARGNRSTEGKLRFGLVRNKISGWQLHPRLMGSPDFVFAARKLVVFVDGCFWHRCPYCNRPFPKTNAKYWREKIRANVKRRIGVLRSLRRQGYRTLTVWEHELTSKTGMPGVLKRIGKALAMPEVQIGSPQATRSRSPRLKR